MSNRGMTEPEESGVSTTWMTGAVLLFAAFHVAASLFFPERLWSAHHLRYLPPHWIGIWAVLLVIVLFPPLRRRTAAAAGALAGRVAALGRPGAFLLAASSAALFLVFRTQNLFLGDGWLISSVVRNPEETGMGSAGYLSLVLHRTLLAVLRAVHPEAGGAAPFRITSALAGAGAVLAALGLAAEAAGERRARRLLFATLLLSGGSLLFFGYVEYYPPMQAALLLYLWLGIRFLRGKGSILFPTAALLLAGALHVSALVYAPTWLVLLFRGRVPGRRTLFVLLPALILAAAAGGWAIFHYTERVYRGSVAFLPLLGKEGYSYGFLSGAHAADSANLLFLLLGGALLFPLLRRRPVRREKDGPEKNEVAEKNRAADRFLLAAAAVGSAVFILLDPKLGSRDWDLMALPLFPLLLLLARPILFGRALPDRDGAALLVGAMLLHGLPWVAVQLDRDRAVRMTMDMVARDPHYDNPRARAPKAFGVLLARKGYDAEAARLFERAAETKQDPQNLYNLGTNRAKRGDFAGAVSPLEEAIRLYPEYREAYINLATVFVRLNEPARAESTLRDLIDVAPDFGRARLLLGSLLVDEGRYLDGLVFLREAVRIDPEDAEAWSRFGAVLAGMGARVEARRALERALAIDPSDERAREGMSLLNEQENGPAPSRDPGERGRR